MARKRITDEDIRVLLRNDGEDESESCSEDELYISSDDGGVNDILLSYPESNYDSSSDKVDAGSTDGIFDNSITYILKLCNGSQALSLIRFTAAQVRASLRNINTEKCGQIMHANQISSTISDCFPFFFTTVFSKQYVLKKIVKFERPVEKRFQCRNAKLH